MPWKSPGTRTKGEVFIYDTESRVIHVLCCVIREYLPELTRARAAREKSLQDAKDASLNRFMSDLAVDRAKNPGAAVEERWESEEENDDEDDVEVDIIDRSELSLILSRLS